jgi:hypothetical protein
MNLPSDMADLVWSRASHWIGRRALVLSAHHDAKRRGNWAGGVIERMRFVMLMANATVELAAWGLQNMEWADRAH